jgi:hypothetical protein
VFTAPSEWKLAYSFQCAGDQQPGMTVDLMQSGKVLKSLVNDAGLDEARVVLIDVGGSNVQLLVQTQCTWQVTGST